MNVEAARRTFASASQATEHFDVLIVGAGISGIGSAWHLRNKMPGTSFVILEMQETFGGTWWTHKYPGIRSDSDLHTFGYSFKPWVGPPIATADEIRAYMGEVIEGGQSLDHRGREDRNRRAGCHQCELPLDVPGLLPPLRRLHAGMGGH